MQRDERRRRFLRRAAAFCATLAVAMMYRTEHLTHWDSWDYASQAIAVQSSDLLLGRWWFIATMRVAFLAGQWLFGLSDLNAHLAMQAACMLMMGGAVVVGMAWVYRLTRSPLAEGLFALLLLSGLNVGIYGSSVMTEGMTMLMVGTALLAWELAISRPAGAPPWAMAAGLCFGVAIDIREPIFLMCAWPILSCLVDRPPRRWLLLSAAAAGTFATLGIGALEAWAWFPRPTGYVRQIAVWTASMAAERRLHGLSLWLNLQYLAAYAALASPGVALLAIPAAPWCWLRRRRLFWLAVGAMPYAGSLMMNHDLTVNSRFLLPLAYVLAPPVAEMIRAAVQRPRLPRLRLAVVVALLAAMGAAPLTLGREALDNYYFLDASAKARAMTAMLTLPRYAMVIPGPSTPVAFFLNRIERTHFEVISSGWDWPTGTLTQIVSQAVESGGDGVYVNVSGSDWTCSVRKDGEWGQLCSAIQQYEARIVQWPIARLCKRQDSPSPRTTREGD